MTNAFAATAVKEELAIDHTWDFAGAKTKYYTHGIHSYPAMMIPQVAERLISEHGGKQITAYDPFCGSGSVLLEFLLKDIPCYGTDINPLAIEISNSKTTILEPTKISGYTNTIKSFLADYLFKSKKPIVSAPRFRNIDFWFKPLVIRDLSVLKEAISRIPEEDYQNFFRICFSETVRKSSNTRGGEFKLYRVSPEKLSQHNPNVFEIFNKITVRNTEGMKQLYGSMCNKGFAARTIFESDIVRSIPLPENSIDLVVSSPPYGDSKTTAAYGQFSRLSLQWLDYDEEKTRQIDNKCMGGRPSKGGPKFKSLALETTLSKISNKDEKRANEVLSFFNDFFMAGENISRVMKQKSKICWVVGNRTVKNVKIPTDEIVSDMFKEFGYQRMETVMRHIPNKKMPRINSPSNVIGETGKTMNEEYIIRLERN